MAFDYWSLLPFASEQHHGFYSKIGNFIKGAWKDYTGQSAVEQQNAANLNLAKYQSQMQEEFYNKYSSPEALMRQYKQAGLNPNLVYGSASAGQGNVPGFSAPQVERNMSGADKINKALSSLSAGLGLVQNVYQAAAAREAAQQASIKTANDIVNYRSNYRDNIFQNDLMGIHVRVPKFSIFTKGQNLSTPWTHGSLYNQYQAIAREAQFNKMAREYLSNHFDFGFGYDSNGNQVKADYMNQGLSPYMFTRNRQAQLKYDLMNELGNTGTYGKLLLSALGLFF